MSDARQIGRRQRFRILMRDGFKCVYCGEQGTNETLHVDHVHPVAAGGGKEDANLVSACEPCNLGKGATVGVELPSAPINKERNAHPLVGLYFVNTAKGNYRGRVLSCDGTLVTVELYDWLFGDATMRYYPIVEMVGDHIDYFRDHEAFEQRCVAVWNKGWRESMATEAA